MSVMTSITFPSHDGVVELSGTVSFPEGEDLRPAVLIVVGSGPIDRDGTASSNIRLNVYSKLASFFTDQLGWICLRYDKRGVGKSTNKNRNLYVTAGLSDLVNDAVEGVKKMISLPRVDRTKVLVAGHSEGAIIIPRMAKLLESIIHPQGFLLLSGFGESIKTALRYQLEQANQEIMKGDTCFTWFLRLFIKKGSMGKKVDELKQQVNSTDAPIITEYCGLSKLQAKWFREHFAYDLATIQADTAHIKSHVIVITGAKDLQVRPAGCQDAKFILAQAASVTVHVPTKMTHLLRQFEGEPKLLSLLKVYQKSANDPLDPEFMDALAQWARLIQCDTTMESSISSSV